MLLANWCLTPGWLFVKGSQISDAVSVVNKCLERMEHGKVGSSLNWILKKLLSKEWRLGELLSHFLYILVIEDLSKMLNLLLGGDKPMV